MNKELILDQAVKVFADINNRMDSLIDCSANDFDVLNKAFIDYHAKIEDLTKNTNLVVEGFLALPEDILKHHLEQLDTLNSDVKSVYDDVQKVVSLLNKLNQDVAYALLFVNNQKQNISTLKLLVTNIQLEPLSRSRYKEIINKIHQLQADNNKLVNEFSRAENQLKICFDTLEKIRSEILPGILKATGQYKSMIFDLVKKKKDFHASHNKLTDLKSRKTLSSSEIITHLQFQDIVRQKIEHVHEAQSNLLEQLHNYRPEDRTEGSTDPDEILRIIYQIRNIGALQAAQMVHANNEYQKAIENIIDKFEELDYILGETTDLLIELMPDVEEDKEYLPGRLDKAKKHLEHYFNSFSDAVSHIKGICTEIGLKNEVLTTVNKEIAVCIKECEQALSGLYHLDSEQGNQTDYTNLTQQIKNNFDGFMSNTRELNKHLDKNRVNTEEQLLPGISELANNFRNLDEAGRNLMHEAETILKKQKSKGINFYKKDLSASKFDNHGIQYYSVFDKEIEEIITNLNQLIDNIDFKEIEKQFESEDFNEIKELYTMDSEREIHATLTGEKKKKKKKKKDKNDLELF